MTGDETWLNYLEPQRKVNNKVWNAKIPKQTNYCKTFSKCEKSSLHLCCLLQFYRPVLQVAAPSGHSITVAFYKYNVLKEVNKYYVKRGPKTGIRNNCLIHDNAPTHKSKIAYSPDLGNKQFCLCEWVHCHEFFLFPRLKRM